MIFFIWDLHSFANKPATPGKTSGQTPGKKTDQKETIIIIKPGQSLSATSQKLYKTSIITNPLKFQLLVRAKKYDKKIQAGEYLLSPLMSPNHILDLMTNGKVILHKITIPEGYNLNQIASLVEETGLGTKETFLNATKDQPLLHTMNINAKTFEGYLFPDTYHFPKKISPKDIIKIMVKRFHSVFTGEWEKQAKNLSFSVHEIVTLASIIEKETGAAFERPMISSVFHNRLKKNMRLETDPTVIYGIKDFDGNITRKHLTTKTQYNTYVIKGLPPGPIANPGKESIKAALFPDSTPYIYFVSKKNKTHQFSTNLADHNKAVRKYQLSNR